MTAAVFRRRTAILIAVDIAAFGRIGSGHENGTVVRNNDEKVAGTLPEADEDQQNQNGEGPEHLV
jgi:hypothetical protein